MSWSFAETGFFRLAWIFGQRKETTPPPPARFIEHSARGVTVKSYRYPARKRLRTQQPVVGPAYPALKELMECCQALLEALPDIQAEADRLVRELEGRQARFRELELQAKKNDAALRLRIAEQAEEIASLRAQVATRWPWGTHSTNLLEQLAAAAEEFWSRYDVGMPKTAPKSEAVAQWLRDKRRSQSSRSSNGADPSR